VAETCLRLSTIEPWADYGLLQKIVNRRLPEAVFVCKIGPSLSDSYIQVQLPNGPSLTEKDYRRLMGEALAAVRPDAYLPGGCRAVWTAEQVELTLVGSNQTWAFIQDLESLEISLLHQRTPGLVLGTIQWESSLFGFIHNTGWAGNPVLRLNLSAVRQVYGAVTREVVCTILAKVATMDWTDNQQPVPRLVFRLRDDNCRLEDSSHEFSYLNCIPGETSQEPPQRINSLIILEEEPAMPQDPEENMPSVPPPPPDFDLWSGDSETTFYDHLWDAPEWERIRDFQRTVDVTGLSLLAPDVVSYFLQGAESDSPFVKFLHFYHCCEYFTEAKSKELVKDKWRQLRRDGKDQPWDADFESYHKEAARILATSEREALKNALLRLDNIATKLSTFLSSPEGTTFCTTQGPLQEPVLNITSAQLVQEVANRVYSVRCGIVHAKALEARLVPYESDDRVRQEIPLVRFLATVFMGLAG